MTLSSYFDLLTGRACLPHGSAYSISKFGVEAFSDALRREMSVAGVSVSIVEPGFFKTALTDKGELERQWNSAWGGLSDELREEYGEKFFKTSKLVASSAVQLPKKHFDFYIYLLSLRTNTFSFKTS